VFGGRLKISNVAILVSLYCQSRRELALDLDEWRKRNGYIITRESLMQDHCHTQAGGYHVKMRKDTGKWMLRNNTVLEVVME